jgi:hypothetical protein
MVTDFLIPQRTIPINQFFQNVIGILEFLDFFLEKSHFFTEIVLKPHPMGSSESTCSEVSKISNHFFLQELMG